MSPKQDEIVRTSDPLPPPSTISQKQTPLKRAWTLLKILLLFINYFLAQYDKFILSYFSTPISKSLHLSPTAYGLLSGYSTGIVYAILALPIAWLADYSKHRSLLLAALAAWWSLCVVLQSLTHNFAQILLARIGMGIGQAGVEALSVSLISDLVAWRHVFVGESVFYVGVYVGEAVSGRIATAFREDGEGWRTALRAIGITGVVVAVLIAVLVPEPRRQRALVKGAESGWGDVGEEGEEALGGAGLGEGRKSFKATKKEFRKTAVYVMQLRSFWLLVLSASFRQLAGNVFGYYMPGYLSATYPSETRLLSNYGIVVGTVGSVAVLTGGILTSILWSRTKMTPIYLTAIGGMISSPFVLFMLFSRDMAGGNENQGVKILYGTMSIAYLTAETWLGCLFALIAGLLPPAYKTFGLAMWSTMQVLIYSAGPEIIGLALREVDVGSEAYRKDTQVALAVIIVVGYWIAGIGLLMAIPLVKRDLKVTEAVTERLSSRRKIWFGGLAIVVLAMVIALFVASIVIAAE
jgi:MFS family permease